MKTSYTIPLAIILGGIIIAVALYASVPKNPAGGNPALVRLVDASDHILGNPAAKVVIVEYSDFDCTYCKGFHETLHQIIANQGTNGDVVWVYRQFPLIEIHPNALSLAKASECAAEVGGPEAFWRFADALFANQPVALSGLGAIAASAEIPNEAFATCYASESAAKPLVERIVADRQNALDMGARGTPYSLILVAGKPPVVMAGGYSYDAVKQLVDEALAN